MTKPKYVWYSAPEHEHAPFGSYELVLLADKADDFRKTISLYLNDYYYNFQRAQDYIKELEGKIYSLEEHIDGKG